MNLKKGSLLHPSAAHTLKKLNLLSPIPDIRSDHLGIWNALPVHYHLYNLKNVKKTHEGVLFIGKLQASACNFNESNTPLWVLFMIFKLYKWYKIAQSVSYISLWMTEKLECETLTFFNAWRHEMIRHTLKTLLQGCYKIFKVYWTIIIHYTLKS